MPARKTIELQALVYHHLETMILSKTSYNAATFIKLEN
jgi:hypothetical protein